MKNRQIESNLFSSVIHMDKILLTQKTYTVGFSSVYGEFTLCTLKVTNQYLFVWATLWYPQTSDLDLKQ